MPKPKKKTYRVPTVVYCTFGCELEVRASSVKEAKKLILAGHGTMPDGEGYDWDRFTEHKYKLGDWEEIEVVDD